jgi:hypothetical protein
MLSMLFCIATTFAQNITKAEYFFDIDPGIGNGTSISNFSPADVINFNANISINALAPGFHVLLMRVRNSDGVWSLTEPRYFYISSNTTVNTEDITAAEYFIDADPGAGNGTSTPIGITGAVVNFTAMIPANLSPGFHMISIRTKDANGKWGLSDTRTFYVYPPAGANMPVITAAEYFFDHDPGVGNGTPLSFTSPGDIVAQTFMILVPASMSAGDHLLTIRAKDQAGTWSLFEKDTLTIGGVSNSISCPANVTINAAGQCSAVVNNIDPVITPAGSAYTYTLSGSTTGSGTGTTSGKTFNAGVTTVTYALTNSPTTTCSFTATVNSNITPSVSIIASSLNICSGQQVAFTATPVNGGATPSYQWKLNGNNIPGATSSTYQSSSLLNDDVISVVMTSSFVCANPLSVQSNNIPIAVTSSVAPTVYIGASATTICSGTTVSFTATPVDGGVNPTYQWKLNGNNVGVNSASYQNSSLQNGDKIKVVITSSALCASPMSAVSEEVTMTVNTAAIPSVTIEANEESICNGQSVTFTAKPNNAGNNPVYEWLVNYNAVGTNSPIFQSSTLVDGDVVGVTMVPSQSCGTNTPVVSNMIIMTVGTNVTPSVTMSYSAPSYCTGSLIIFYASPISGAGNSPSYQWKRNGINIPGATSSTYQSSSLENGDVIRVAMTSSLSCANPQTVLSHDSATLSISSVALTPSVTISASAATICQGETVTFTALPTNGGDVPGYQWKLNGINVGENEEVFSTNSLQNGDQITVEMTSYAPCITNPTTTSSPVTMAVTTIITYYADLDGDGYGNGASGVAEACIAPAGYVPNNGDCDDNNASVHPGSTEICGNGIDDDCDGQTDEACGSPDNDGDGYTVAQGDCNDNNAAIHPGAAEICGNGIDDDCDGQTDEACSSPDNDGDGYTVTQGDCNDNNAAIHPGAAEVCNNSIDDDCDGQVDEDCNASAPLPVLILRTYPVKEGDVGQTILNVEVNLDMPAPLPVSVHYSTINDDAIAGSDYVATNGVLVIPAGSVSGSLQIRIIGDLLRENNERFRINFSNPVNAVLNEDPYSRIMIIDNDKGKNDNNATARTDQVPVKEEIFKIPTVTKRNQVWMISQIGNYENEVLIVNVQGQVVSRFVNYHNQTSLGNVSTGLYFYRIKIMESRGQYKYYSGRLLITE